jgi:hypothetical protein
MGMNSAPKPKPTIATLNFFAMRGRSLETEQEKIIGAERNRIF